MKNWRKNHGLADCLTSIAQWVLLNGKQYKNAKQGILSKFGRKASKQEKKRGSEKKSNYKGPDSTKRMLNKRPSSKPHKRN